MSSPKLVSFADAPFDIIDGDRGKNYPQRSEFTETGHCLFLSATNVTKSGFSFSECQFIDPKRDAALNKGKLQREDIVLTTRGTIGNTAYYNQAVPLNHLRINSGMVILRCDRSKLLPAYLYHFVRSPDFFTQVNGLRSGVAQPQLPIRDMRRIKLPLPGLTTQRKIAGILSAYDDLIENNLRRIKILEEMAQSLYREWFVHFRFPGHESVKMVDSALGQIPEGWEVKTLDELTEVILDCRGKTPKKLGGDWSDEGIVALSALNVKTGHLIKMDQAKTLSEELYSKWMKTPLERHDVLLTSEAPLGECYLLPDNTRYCLSQRLFALRANPEMISPALLFYSLISEQGQARLQNRATGTTVRGIRQAALREVEILVPHQKIRKLAGAFFEETAAQLANLHCRNENLRLTRDLLLPKLLTQ